MVFFCNLNIKNVRQLDSCCLPECQHRFSLERFLKHIVHWTPKFVCFACWKFDSSECGRWRFSQFVFDLHCICYHWMNSIVDWKGWWALFVLPNAYNSVHSIQCHNRPASFYRIQKNRRKRENKLYAFALKFMGLKNALVNTLASQ